MKSERSSSPALEGLGIGKAGPFEMPICHLNSLNKSINFQVASTWTKITACDGYAMVRNRKEPENR